MGNLGNVVAIFEVYHTDGTVPDYKLSDLAVDVGPGVLPPDGFSRPSGPSCGTFQSQMTWMLVT